MTAWIDHITQNLHNKMSEPWSGEANLVGTMVDRKALRIPGVGEHADDAVLVFMQAVRCASDTTNIFGQLWKTIRNRRTVDMWLYDHREQWRSVSFEVQFHPMLDDLYMFVSTYVPFGVGGDRSHYPLDRNKDCIRSTQRLFASVDMQARRIFRTTEQALSTRASAQMTSQGYEASSRVQTGNTTSSTHRATHTNGQGVERTNRGVLSGDMVIGPFDRHHTDRESGSNESLDERRYEAMRSVSREHSDSNRGSSEDSWREELVSLTDDLVELTEDVGFSAVGPDHSQPDRLYTSWRSDPGNREASLTIDLVNLGLPSLGRIIEQGVSQRRLERRALRQCAQPDFWKEAQPLMASYNPVAYGQRIVLEHDGEPRPIRPADMAAAIQQARLGMGQLTGRSHFLPPGH